MKIIIPTLVLLLAIWLCDNVLPQVPWIVAAPLAALLTGGSSFLVMYHLHTLIFGHKPRFFP